MAVIVKYVVERNGVEKMTFAAKSEADAYDKMLDMADDLFVVLGASQLITDENIQETLALFLAQHKDDVLQALGAKAKTAKKDKTSEDKGMDDKAIDDNGQHAAAEVESTKATELNLIAA